LLKKSMNPAIFTWLIYALWLVLVVYLVVADRDAKPDTQTHLGHSLGLMFAMIAAILLPHLAIFTSANCAPVTRAGSMMRSIICVAGRAVLVTARQQLGQNWSQTVAAKEAQELVTSGPYRYVRHPMYTGGIIACIGSAIVAGGAFVFFLIILTPLFLWRVSAE